ncbi:hypothetical protein ScalyP_jg7742, partial [Parmales sp. scaly parma]
MDGIDTGKGKGGQIILIATTGRPLGEIDAALLRPGRLSVQVEIGRAKCEDLLEVMCGIMLEGKGGGWEGV